jgi:O-antigen/teichoic acid export membrane protein
MSGNYPVAKLRRALVLFAGGRAVQALGRMALVLAVVRLLAPEDYGAYMLIVGISEMLLQTFSLGILPVGQRFLPQLLDSASPRDVRRFMLGISAVQFCVLLIVVRVCWGYWDDLLPLAGFDTLQIEHSRPAVWLLLFVPAFRFVADLLETLLAQGKAQTARALMPLGRLIGIGAVLLAGVEITLERILYIDSAVTVVCLLVAWLFMIGCLNAVASPNAPQPLPVKAMLRHAWHMSAVDLMGSASAPGAIRIVLASTLGIAESGLFAFLQSLERLVSRYLPSVLLRGLVRPMMISRIGRKNGVELMELGAALLRKSNLLIIAAGAMVIFFGGDRIVSMASGGRFPGSGDTLLLMLLVLSVTSQRLVLEMLMQIFNQTHILRVTALLAPVALGLVWLSAGYGLNVAILVSASGVAVANTITMARLRSITGEFRPDWRGTSGIVLPAIIGALFGYAVQTILGTWVAAVAAGVVMIALLAAAKPFVAGELQMADRGMGGFVKRLLGPFAREAAQ